ncbi:hypothetical protein Rumeso_02106 [Rubellimicrobium mesophilum DSM 19309]|uniref:Uncharacterized protein n=1 Tax=Rubellimicrobium mesophilum DSM 19309 TaxID=442562 RepID=A0A017HPI3_9RHOB|nr:hypothetical protein Rumeso_02106 [Rubellimicrobium mesophilum DSM 19309]
MVTEALGTGRLSGSLRPLLRGLGRGAGPSGLCRMGEPSPPWARKSSR